MKKKGGLNDYKLFFEDISLPKNYRPTVQKAKTPFIKIVVARIYRGLVFVLRYIFQSLQALYQTAILDLDDNKTVQKMPSSNKANSRNKKR